MIKRGAVLWIGADPDDGLDALLKRRGLTLEQRTAPTDVDFRTARAVVFSATGRSAASLHAPLDSYGATALTHSLQVIVRLEATNHALLQARYRDFTNRWTFFDPTTSDDEHLAEIVRSHEPGPAENELLEVPDLTPALLDEDRVLLRRAFNDSDVLVLKELTEGKSSARVLRAHAKRAGGDPPGFMLPFLVKVDSVENIEAEIDRYGRFVAGHVPFTQRPNLNPARCVAGARRAVMVSDFVEDAVPLSALCERPEGRRVVYSLFDDALRSWRRHAFLDSTATPLALTDHLGDVLQTSKISSAVRARARSYGLRCTPEALASDLSNCSKHSWKLGIIHGDLHPGNVMVRGAEAILIDFASIWDAKKPLVADLACLEVGICFTVATEGCVRSPGRLHAEAFAAWTAAVDELFGLQALTRVRPQQEPRALSWLWDACRQTRSMAAQLDADPAAYGAALALYLLRRARLGGHGGQNPAVEAYALLTAGRVIRLLKEGRL